MQTYSKIKRITLTAKVIRADGTIEDLGVISDSGILDDEPKKRTIRDFVSQLLRRVKING